MRRWLDVRERSDRGVWSLILVLGLAVGVGCGGAQKTEDDDSVVGKPPSAQADPFRIMNTPETAEEASTSGYIGAKAEEESTESKGAEAEQEETTSSQPMAVEASEATPPDGTEEPPKAAPDEVQCFSCVRICPVSKSGDETDCSGGERDVICGWGVHESRESAARLARAECDGALDMARQMKTWSRIDGACPAARCKTP